MSLKLIGQLTLALIYGTLFISVLPTFVISQTTSVADTKLNHYLPIKEPEKPHQLQTPFQVNV